MTQIRPLTQPRARRPGELGVHSLDRFNFAVPDIEAGAEILFVLRARRARKAGNALHIHTHGHPHRWGSVVEGPRKKLQFISFGAFEDDLPRFRERLERCGSSGSTRRRAPNRTASGSAIPTARRSRSASPRRARRTRSRPSTMSRPVRACRAPPSRSQRPLVQPRRLAHMLVFTRDIPQAIKFYGEVLGLRLSDRSGDMIAFMHGDPRQRSPHDRLREIGRPRPASPELGRPLDQRHRHRRHADGRQGFHRRLGTRPPRARIELFPLRARPLGQLRRIFLRHRLHSGRSRLEGRRPSARGSFYVWGPTPPEDFAFNYEAAS